MVDLLTDWVAYNACRFPEETALEDVERGTRQNWTEVEARVARLAGFLSQRLGIVSGDRVGLLAEDDPRSFELQFACMRLGAIFVPFNWRLTTDELSVLVDDAGPTVLVHDVVWQEAAETLARRHGDLALVSWGVSGATVDFDEGIEAASPVPAQRGHHEDQVVQILYTSGTTGLPKGAMITLGNLVWNALNVIPELKIAGPPAKHLSSLPLFHAAGLNAISNPILMSGGAVSILRRFDPAKVADLLGDPRNGYTHNNGVPAVYRMIAECDNGHRDFSSVRAALSGGGALDAWTADYFSERGLELHSGWGATEMGPSLTFVGARDRVSKAHTVGFPVQHLQVRVVDPVTGEDVAPGEEGEAWVRGPSISKGYWRREPEDDIATKEGWFKSGDAISIDEDGYISLRGRFKDMYKSGGENVFAAEVERVISSHPSVQEAAVIGVPDERWGEVGHAVVVPETGQQVETAEILDHCRSKLAKYKVPVFVTVVDSFPRNVTGKIQKNVLREHYI